MHGSVDLVVYQVLNLAYLNISYVETQRVSFSIINTKKKSCNAGKRRAKFKFEVLFVRMLHGSDIERYLTLNHKGFYYPCTN